MNKYWIKLYHEILNDPKMGKLSDHLFRRTIELFLIAGENGSGGRLPSVEDIAWRLHADVDGIQIDLENLQPSNIVSFVDGEWYVTKFSERQAPTPATERWKQWNERKNNQQYYSNEPTNETQTNRLQELNEKLSDKNRSDIDKEEDNEEKREDSAANAAPPPPRLKNGQIFTLQAFGAKRFKTSIQRETVSIAEDIYGLETLKKYITWAANKGLGLGDAVVGMERALPKWGQPKNGRSLKEELRANGYIVN